MSTRRLFRIPRYTAWFYPRRIWFGEKDSVYLTFDDGPHPEITLWLLDELKNQQLKATFFWLGEQVEKFPELLERALKEGHKVGNHGYHHNSGRKQTYKEFVENYEKGKAQIKSDLFRPPYGDLKKQQAKYALANGKLVMWTWMAYDFDQNLSIERIISIAEKQIRGGDIIVLHENDKTVTRLPKLLPELIKIIRNKELKFEII